MLAINLFQKKIFLAFNKLSTNLQSHQRKSLQLKHAEKCLLKRLDNFWHLFIVCFKLKTYKNFLTLR